jgi:hypothetical protein
MTLGEQHLSFWTEHLDDPSFVYVIQGEQGSPIKIGVAKNVKSRIAGLQTGNPQRLRLLHVLPGDGLLERALHQRLRESAIHGEWFGGSEIESFLVWIGDYAQQAVNRYLDTGELPKLDPKPKPRHTGWRVGGYRKVGARWRVADPDDDKRVISVSFVEPNPKMDPEEAQEMRAKWPRWRT